ncbi:uncharacterized [Tachysurus ichikawai]
MCRTAAEGGSVGDITCQASLWIRNVCISGFESSFHDKSLPSRMHFKSTIKCPFSQTVLKQLNTACSTHTKRPLHSLHTACVADLRRSALLALVLRHLGSVNAFYSPASSQTTNYCKLHTVTKQPRYIMTSVTCWNIRRLSFWSSSYS